MKKEESSEPRYADCFAEYTIAVGLLGELYKEGSLPREVYERIMVEYQKDVEKYRKTCYYVTKR